MGRYLALVEQDGLPRIDARRHEGRRGFADVSAQGFGVLPDRDRMQIDKAVDRFRLAPLKGREPLERAQIVAQRQTARRLDARKDARRETGFRRLGHVGLLGFWLGLA